MPQMFLVINQFIHGKQVKKGPVFICSDFTTLS